ncbi:ribosome association toxin RatA [Alphaproteobacteria bacterium]|nr:ribosome association toxin RatA [Alphaproteobacteria bacterium]
MPFFKQSKILPYSAKQMFDLVIDIEKYSEFLPWCKNARIISKISPENIQAELLINFKNFFEKYTSDVQFARLENGEYFVDVVAIKGPFKSLINKWQFIPIDQNQCLVEFYLEFEFNSKILSKMFSTIFHNATQKMMSAFEDRAKKLYHK